MRTRLSAGFLVVAATAAAYGAVRHHQFLNFDDPAYITDNPMVRAGLSWDGLRWAFSAGHAGNWHPLTWLSHMADVSLCGLEPGCHHVMNVAFHILSALLLLRFLYTATGRVGASACVAGLFALHPLHVESVAWIAERKDVLSTFWWMAAINIYAGGGERPSWARLAALAAASAAAMLSKPMAVTLPFTLLLLDIWPLRRWQAFAGGGGWLTGLAARVRATWPVFLMAGALCVVTFIVQRQAGAVQSVEAFPVALRLANVPVAYATYLLKTAWPAGLAPLYPYPEVLPPWQWIAALGLLLAITIGAVRLRARAPVVLVGWLWFLGTLLPVIGLVQVGAQPFADRYTYVPLVGVFLMVVWGVAGVIRSRAAAVVAGGIAVAAIAALAVATSRQVEVWRDSVTLWTHAVSATTGNYRAQTNLGFALARAESSARAEAAYREALRLKPDYPRARNYLGALLLELDRPQEAEAELRAALAVWPRFAEARNSLGMALAAQDRQADAIREFEIALAEAPSFAQARNNLGIALARSGRLTDAIAAFEASVRLQPASAEAHLNLAVALLDAGRPLDARPHLDAAIRYGDGSLREMAEKLRGGR